MLDTGANAEVQPEWLVQFAQMGSVYATAPLRHRRADGRPAVDRRGAGQGRHAAQGGLRAARGDAGHPASSATSRAATCVTKAADVIVTDGFTGNVALKTLEGALKALLHRLLDRVRRDPGVQGARRRPGAAWCWPVIAELTPDTYGGAVLLGVDGVCIISHGSSARRRWSTRSRWPATWSRRDLVDAPPRVQVRLHGVTPGSRADRHPTGYGSPRADRCHRPARP